MSPMLVNDALHSSYQSALDTCICDKASTVNAAEDYKMEMREGLRCQGLENTHISMFNILMDRFYFVVHVAEAICKS